VNQPITIKNLMRNVSKSKL